MTEIDTTLTDYAIAILCFWFAWQLFQLRSQWHEWRRLWIAFFITIAFAAIAGGTVHGFFSHESSLGYEILWSVTLLSIGLTASVAWMLTGLIYSGDSKLKPWIIFAAIEFIFYSGVVIFFSQKFAFVILNYLPAIVALLIVSIRNYYKNRAPYFIWISMGILVSFLAAYIQQARIAIHPTYFNHNSAYHLVQAFGLWLYYRGSRGRMLTTPF